MQQHKYGNRFEITEALKQSTTGRNKQYETITIIAAGQPRIPPTVAE